MSASRNRPVGSLDRAAPEQAVGTRQVLAVVRLQAEHRAIEERGLVEVVEWLRQHDVIDRLQVRVGVLGLEFDEVPEPVLRAAVRATEEDRGLVRRGDRRQLGLARSAPARQHRREQCRRAFLRAGGIRALDPERRNDRIVRGAVVAVVEQHARAALLP